VLITCYENKFIEIIIERRRRENRGEIFLFIGVPLNVQMSSIYREIE